MTVPTWKKLIEPTLRYLADHTDRTLASDTQEAAVQTPDSKTLIVRSESPRDFMCLFDEYR